MADNSNITLCYLEHLPDKYFTIYSSNIGIYKDLCKNNLISISDKDKVKEILSSGNFRGRYKDGERDLPSVTQILNLNPITSKREWLLRWYDKIDSDILAEQNEKNQKIMNRGTELHKCFEEYLNYNTIDINALTKDEEIKVLLRKFIGAENSIRVIATEKFYKGSKVCGTIDLIAKKNGLLSLIDFKTTSKDFYAESQLHDYVMQLSAYKKLFEQNNPGIKIEKCYIYQFSFKLLDYTVFEIDLQNLLDAEIQYKTILDWYWSFFS
ncbi:MAG: PD-(D/E)XK nuclease family protein [Spirochaetota bacterium]|nr:PD-(D/E)XK nuclease family protein [Spirochaetota bacterium]